MDEKKKYCDFATLSFQTFPEIIEIDGQKLSPHILPKCFSAKLNFANDDFRGISFFHKTEMTQPSIGQDVVNIAYSLVFTALAAGLLIILLLLCACYLKIPQVLATILFCVSKQCCL